jgi:hypothetical protein
MPELTEAYVLGLLADLEVEVPAVERKLSQARKRASAVDAELSNLIRRQDESRRALARAQASAGSAVAELAHDNMRVAHLHQEIAGIRRRSDDLKTEMERSGPGAIHRRLRRERAKLSIQIEDREKEIERLRNEVDRWRVEHQEWEERAVTERDRSRVIARELDALQAQLPSPYLYVDLYDRLAARTHCRMFVDREPQAWRSELRNAIAVVLELHHELRAGKYRLDKNSDIVGGRAMATAEALYGAAALGDLDLVRELFEVATDPSLFFHQIFNVFRVWCLGLYVGGEVRDLRELLRIHQFAPGLRGGYVQAFIGLALGERERVTAGLQAIAKHEWEMWQDPGLVRGAGVINLGAVAITRLARERGLAVRLPGPTVPDLLIAEHDPPHR